MGGFNYSTHVDIVEVISLDPLQNPVPDCMKNLQPFPFPFVDAAGDTMDGKKEGLNLFRERCIIHVYHKIEAAYLFRTDWFWW